MVFWLSPLVFIGFLKVFLRFSLESLVFSMFSTVFNGLDWFLLVFHMFSEAFHCKICFSLCVQWFLLVGVVCYWFYSSFIRFQLVLFGLCPIH